MEEYQENQKRRRTPLYLIVVLFVSPLILLPMICLPGLLNAKRSALESRAKSSLKAFVAMELDFQQRNDAGAYGSWDDLSEAGYLAEDSTPENFIGEYTVMLTVNNPCLIAEPESIMAAECVNTFTIVAFPRKTSPPGYLATFAISEDQVLRVFRYTTPGAKAWGEDDDFGARTWEPLH